jgi:predicted short-subunit dehydrogenase-like oxidoreductase (DUF2520 family)
MKSIGIIGFGSLGRSLAEALNDSGRLAWLMIRDQSKHDSANYLNVPIFSEIAEISLFQDAIILAIPDKDIQGIVDAIHHVFSGEESCAIIHCSGALKKDVLNGSNPMIKGIAMHPFQSIRNRADLHGIPWGIECEYDEQDSISEIILSLNGLPFFLDEYSIELKALYHATAVVSANFITILTAYSAELAKKANIPPEIFLPKIQSTVLERAHEAMRNQQSIIEGLTGPLRRMDESTILENRKAILSIPGMDEMYCSMCKAGIELLVKEDLLTNQQRNRLLEVLHELPSDGQNAS